MQFPKWPTDIKLATEDARLVSLKEPLSVGVDLCAKQQIILQPGVPQLFKSGVFVEACPSHLWLQIEPKSGLAAKGVVALGGVIDPSYRGEIGVILLVFGKGIIIQPYEPYVQMVIRETYYPHDLITVNGETLQPLQPGRGYSEGGLWQTKS